MNTKALADMRWLGVSGLAVGVFATLPDAEASIIIGDSVGGKVGFDSGYGATYDINFPGPGTLSFGTASSGGIKQIQVQGAPYALVKTNSSLLAMANSGAKWGTLAGASTAAAFGTHRQGTVYAPAGYSHRYLLFKFDTGGSTIRYGWADLSLVNNPTTGPDLTIHRWAYDDSGAEIAAGAVPEPASAAAATGMALVMGAAGVRAWRKQRQTKA